MPPKWRDRYPEQMRALALLVILALTFPACSNGDEPTITYQYQVRGTGDDVQVRYFEGTGPLVEEVVSLPWSSDEYQGTSETTIRIDVDGPDGSHVECVVRHHVEGSRYGGDGSGEKTQMPTSSDEDLTVCSIDQKLGP